jgi:general secretion pathway protein D
LETLSSGNSAKARELFVEAWKYEASMDLTTRNQLKEKLTLMQPGRLPAVEPNKDAAPLTAIQKADLEAQELTRKVYRELSADLASINEIQETKPMEALDRLQKLRLKVSQAKLGHTELAYSLQPFLSANLCIFSLRSRAALMACSVLV